MKRCCQLQNAIHWNWIRSSSTFLTSSSKQVSRPSLTDSKFRFFGENTRILSPCRRARRSGCGFECSRLSRAPAKWDMLQSSGGREVESIAAGGGVVPRARDGGR